VSKSLDVAAFTGSRIQRLHDPDPAVHWQRCASEGLECPLEVFTQLFHEEAANADFAAIVRAVEWGQVHWQMEGFSGVALRQVRVDRGYLFAVDEARDHTAKWGIRNGREPHLGPLKRWAM